MADEKILKPKSFRIDDDTADKFKEIALQIGGNQQETLAKLIETYEFQSGKAVLTERKADIEQFEKYVAALTRMFMGVLEDNQNVTSTVRTEFEALLQSKDMTIQELQSQLTIAKQIKSEAEGKAKSYADENDRLSKEILSLKSESELKIKNMQAMLDDKQNLNKALTDSCNSLKNNIDAMTSEYEKLADIQKELASTTAERDSLRAEKEQAEKLLNQALSEHKKAVTDLKEHENEVLKHCREQSQLELDKALLERDRKFQEQLQVLNESKQAEIDKYQAKYFELLEKNSK